MGFRVRAKCVSWIPHFRTPNASYSSTIYTYLFTTLFSAMEFILQQKEDIFFIDINEIIVSWMINLIIYEIHFYTLKFITSWVYKFCHNWNLFLHIWYFSVCFQIHIVFYERYCCQQWNQYFQEWSCIFAWQLFIYKHMNPTYVTYCTFGNYNC